MHHISVEGPEAALQHALNGLLTVKVIGLQSMMLLEVNVAGHIHDLVHLSFRENAWLNDA